ncbi:MAG: hypothetical protein Q8N23_07910 [Archangium sp.]|nr:hypothetical protein [Archangium sp.]MDP3152577.1 hypothetical protein [Archangium sp.]MDP3570997.1 hypothetical protein [Archangium sp.]
MWLIDNELLTLERRATLESQVLPLGSLQEVVRWGFALTPPANVDAVIVQDEFSHDVVMRWNQGQYLAFDTT